MYGKEVFVFVGNPPGGVCGSAGAGEGGVPVGEELAVFARG